MNQPQRPEMFDRAKGLVQQAADAGGRAFQRARDAGRDMLKADDDAGKRRKLILLTAAGIFAVILGIFFLTRIGGDDGERTQVDARQAVTAITLAPRPLNTVVALNGEARPKRDIQVTAPATGVRILDIMVDEGDQVRAGQPMARLDTALSAAMTRAAQASVAEAESAAVQARGEYQRAESIRDSGALSTEAIESRRAAMVAANARLAAAQAQLAENNTRLGGGYVRAPAAGLVIDRSAEIGRNVDGQVLFRIAAGNDLEVSAQVAEADMLALQEGQSAVFQLVDGSSVTARLSRLPASIDPRTRTGEALFDLPRNSEVRAGMYLRGQAELAPREVLAAPQSSILYENGQAYVYVIQDGRAHRANVDLGARDGDWVEVKDGLTANQQIVGAGAAFLRDGDAVRALSEQAPAQAPDGDALRGREKQGG